MLEAPNLKAISRRLQNVHLEPWGPDGVRYICILFWNYLGYRILTDRFDRREWEKWSMSTGDFWDLYLAGCYMYASEDRYVETALPLTSGPRSPFYWSQSQSKHLEDEIAAAAARSGSPEWHFTGPLELVAVGARRDGTDFCIDWASLRFANISPIELSEAVSYYAESHVMLDSDIVPQHLPSPGDFEDTLPRDLIRALSKHVGLLKLFLPHHGHGVL